MERKITELYAIRRADEGGAGQWADPWGKPEGNCVCCSQLYDTKAAAIEAMKDRFHSGNYEIVTIYHVWRDEA